MQSAHGFAARAMFHVKQPYSACTQATIMSERSCGLRPGAAARLAIPPAARPTRIQLRRRTPPNSEHLGGPARTRVSRETSLPRRIGRRPPRRMGARSSSPRGDDQHRVSRETNVRSSPPPKLLSRTNAISPVLNGGRQHAVSRETRVRAPRPPRRPNPQNALPTPRPLPLMPARTLFHVKHVCAARPRRASHSEPPATRPLPIRTATTVFHVKHGCIPQRSPCRLPMSAEGARRGRHPLPTRTPRAPNEPRFRVKERSWSPNELASAEASTRS
jgi:hypothetical protein